MTVKDSVTQLIKEHIPVPVPILDTSNLYTDLLLDSLSYITLLTAIEEQFSITFAIAEMELSLQVGTLIENVENKIRKRGYGND